MAEDSTSGSAAAKLAEAWRKVEPHVRRGVDATRRFLAKADAQPSGLLAAAVAWGVCTLVGVVGWVPLSLPAKALNEPFTRMQALLAACTDPPGTFGHWVCIARLTAVTAIGSILLAILLFLFRRQLGNQVRRLTARLPAEARFLAAPVVATVLLTAAWAGVQYHFFGRTGIVVDGLFPGVVGLATFATARWGPAAQERLAALLRRRERLSKYARIGILTGVTLLLSFLLTDLIHAGVRDQLLALVGIAGSWALFAPLAAPGPGAKGDAGGAATTALAVLLAIVALAPPVAAMSHCLSEDFGDVYLFPQECEETHHSGVAGGIMGILVILIMQVLGTIFPDLGGAGSAPAGGLAAAGTGIVASPHPPRPAPPPSPATDLPPLIDPWEGKPLIVQDGSYQGGKPGQVWWGGEWIDRADAIEKIKEGQKAVDQRQQEFDKFLHESQTLSEQWMKDAVKKGEAEAAAEALDKTKRDNAWKDYENLLAAADAHGYDDITRKLEEKAFKPDGTLDVDYVTHLADITKNKIKRDIAAPDETLQEGWAGDFVRTTVSDAVHNPLIRVGAGILSSGSSEVFYQGLAAGEAMQDAVNKAVDKGEDYGFTDGIRDGLKVLGEENLPLNTIKAMQDPNASWGQVGGGLILDAFTAADVADSVKNIRGGLPWGDVHYKDPEGLLESVKHLGEPNVKVPDGPLPNGLPVEIPKDWGMPKENAIHVKNVADDMGVKIDMRPTTPHAPEHLANGAVPKPYEIKNKTIDDIDVEYLGRPEGSQGLAAHFDPGPKPARPPDLDDDAWKQVEKRWQMRKDEFADYGDRLGAIEKKGYKPDQHGIFHKDGKPVTGDHDVFQIRNHDGRPLEESILEQYMKSPAHKDTPRDILIVRAQEDAWKIKQQVIDRLKGDPANVQHGAHMDWLEYLQRTKGETALTPKDQKVFDNIITKHHDEALIEFGGTTPVTSVGQLRHTLTASGGSP